jgi:hypothetical protein
VQAPGNGPRQKNLAAEQIHLHFAPLAAAVVDDTVDADGPYCRIRECYPDGAIGADDPTSTDRLSFGSFEARATGGAVGGSGPS